MKRTTPIIRFRWWIIVTTLLLVAASIIPLLNIHINPDLESYLPDSMISRQNQKKINEAFGNEEMLLIVFEAPDVLEQETLLRVQQISDFFAQMPQFTVFSLFQAKDIQSGDGMMIVDPLIDQIPETAIEREELRRTIMSNELAYKLTVSEDFRYMLIMLGLDGTVGDEELMEMVQESLDSFPGQENVYVTGLPYLREESNKKIGRDLIVLLPVGLLVMFLVLLISFRDLKSVMLPFSVVLFSIMICMAFIPIFGWELSLIGVLIPIMMIAIANNYGVYFVVRYHDVSISEPEISVFDRVKKTVDYLKTPVVLCGLTTIVGILGLVAHLLHPARQMGVVTAIGVTFALSASLLYIPAVLSFQKKEKKFKKRSGGNGGFFLSLSENIAKYVVLHPKMILVTFIVFLALCTSGLFFLKTAPDSNKVMPANHSYNKAITILDNHFGGSKMIQVMFEGNTNDPYLLQCLDRYEKELKTLSNVGTVSSLSTVVKKISTALNDPGEPGYDQIPETSEAVAQYLELYALSGDPGDLEQFVNFDNTKTLMTIQFHADKISEIDQVIEKIGELTESDSLEPVLGGFSLTDRDLSESVKRGQYYSLLAAFIFILILLSIIFKSVQAGIIGSLPLVFAVFCTFGLMGWLGIELNIVTALLSSISIGLGVDFTIHVFWRIQWELAQGNDYAGSIITTLKTMGRGIIINASSVMLGFAVLFLSAFPLIRSFAFLIIISLFLCLVSALVFIPAICYCIRPKFLEKKTNKIIA